MDEVIKRSTTFEELDEFITANIPEDLIPITWDKIKGAELNGTDISEFENYRDYM